MDKINYKAVLKNIDTLIFDVDGVLTDSTVIVTSDGDLLRKMNTRDGFALKTAGDCGLNVCIISGGTNKGVKKKTPLVNSSGVFYWGDILYYTFDCIPL